MSEIERLTREWAPALAGFLKNDPEAVAFVAQCCAVAHIWDDLIDRDQPVSDQDINGAFWIALIELPRNGFYRRHFAELQPVMRLVATNWLAATRMERDGTHREITYVLRSAYIDILTTAASLVGGQQWANQITPDIRRWAHAESYPEYVANIQLEQETRDGALQ